MKTIPSTSDPPLQAMQQIHLNLFCSGSDLMVKILIPLNRFFKIMTGERYMSKAICHIYKLSRGGCRWRHNVHCCGSLLRQHSSIYLNYVTRNVSGVIRSEKQRWASHIIWFAGIPERNVFHRVQTSRLAHPSVSIDPGINAHTRIPYGPPSQAPWLWLVPQSSSDAS